MTGIPSIVAGLFAVGLFIAVTGNPGFRAGIVAAVGLAVLMIPIVIRSTEEMLKLVPDGLREASYALGVSKYRTIRRIVLPTAAAGVVTGVVLAIARVIGDTAVLLVTAGATDSVNWNPFDGRMTALPTFTYYQYASASVPPQFSFDRAWAGALTLIIIILGLNLLARAISNRVAVKTR
jgi:phosphate transport system permease protein